MSVTPKKALVVCSGGMDSITALYWTATCMPRGLVLSFDYGQRHRRELLCAEQNAHQLGWPHQVIDISQVRGLLAGSSITDSRVDTPRGHYSAENMRQTVVPGRNAMMLSIAWGIAAAQGCDAVVCGVHAGDHAIYPDCRPDFVQFLEGSLRLGTAGHAPESLHLATPFLHLTKVEILRLGLKLGVNYDNTWTCYEGADVSCGACGACTERREAFKTVGVADPLEYAA